MARRRKAAAHPKRIAVTDDEGWTTITTTVARRLTNRVALNLGRTQGEDESLPSEEAVTKLRAEYERHSAIWLKSICHARVIAFLREQFLSVSGKEARMKKCVCLGLGSFTNGQSARSALFQLAAMISLLAILGLRAEESYVQDPVFTPLDKSLLSSLNLNVVDHPKGFQLVDQETLVFAPHCDRSFFFPGLKDKDPSLTICNSFEKLLDSPGSVGAEEMEIQFAVAFTSGKQSRDWPEFEEGWTAFNDLRIYIRSEGSVETPTRP